MLNLMGLFGFSRTMSRLRSNNNTNMAASLHETDPSSEDENEARFKEAAIDSFQLLHKNESSRSGTEKKEKKPSLRPDCRDEEEDDYFLNTTPGFRKHVSRKLGELIDSQIQEVDTNISCSCPTTETEGIKLLSGSRKFIQTDEDTKIPQRKRRRTVSSSSSDSSDEEKFAEAAVSHDFIVKESHLLHHKPADIIVKAELEGNEGAKTSQSGNVSKDHKLLDSELLNNSPPTKHKKKKKKKKKTPETEDRTLDNKR